MKKRLILLSVLCLLFVLSVALSACGNSDTNNESGDNKTNTVVYLPYDIDETGTIKRFYANESNGANIVIPATYSINENGRIIVGTACEIKSIGAYCFANNNLIETVSVPDTIVSIQEKAFFNCAKLKRINVCKNITSIGADAFEECPQLTTVTRHGTDGLKLEKNTNLSVFSIPDTITKIDNEAFAKWEELTTICMSGMKSVEELHIESDVTSFGAGAFSGCSGLTNVYFSTDGDWEYTFTAVTTERGTISKAVMNNPRQLAEQLKKLNLDYHLYKL